MSLRFISHVIVIIYMCIEKKSVSYNFDHSLLPYHCNSTTLFYYPIYVPWMQTVQEKKTQNINYNNPTLTGLYIGMFVISCHQQLVDLIQLWWQEPSDCQTSQTSPGQFQSRQNKKKVIINILPKQRRGGEKTLFVFRSLASNLWRKFCFIFLFFLYMKKIKSC